MSYPEQIQKQVDAANAVIESYTKQVIAGEVPGETPPATHPDDGKPPTHHADTPPAAASDVTPSPAAVPPAEDENSWSFKQRWQSLQGQYNNLQHQAQQAVTRVGQLEQLIANMQAAPAPAPSQAPAATKITDADRETFGSDMVDMVQRAATDIAHQQLAEKDQVIRDLYAKVQQLQGLVPTVQRVAQATAETAAERFVTSLSQHVPDWQQINDNQQFRSWLLQVDPMTGITRQTYLSDAENSGDLGRVVTIFNTWKQLSGGAAAQPQQARPNSAQNELERQVAPGRVSASTPAPVSPAAKTWTRQGIAKFFDDARKGAYKDRESERAALERDIFVAQKEGRVSLSA